MNRTKTGLLVCLIVLLITTSINPIYPQEQLLQHLGTLLLLGLLLWDMRRGSLSLLAFGGLAAFTALHIIGARWIYSYVPYHEWGEALGLSVGSDIARNHYDRLVHFTFGMAVLPAAYDLLRARFGANLWLLAVAWCLIQVGSMLYELFEWGLAVTLSPQASERYNGQQGDLWDAHKDMALALVGSTLTVALYYTYYYTRRHTR